LHGDSLSKDNVVGIRTLHYVCDFSGVFVERFLEIGTHTHPLACSLCLDCPRIGHRDRLSWNSVTLEDIVQFHSASWYVQNESNEREREMRVVVTIRTIKNRGNPIESGTTNIEYHKTNVPIWLR